MVRKFSKGECCGHHSMFEVSTPQYNSFIFTVVPNGSARAMKHGMKPFPVPSERRHFKRFDMATRDCRLSLMRVRGGKRERENCTLGILTDLSYSGLRFSAPSLIHEGEVLGFVISIASPLNRSGFARGRVCWVHALGSREFDCGVELLENSKGLIGPDEQWTPLTAHGPWKPEGGH